MEAEPEELPGRASSVFHRVGPALFRSLRGDPLALAPSPLIDGALGELVDRLVRPGMSPDVVRQVCDLIDSVPFVRRRAAVIKRASAIAETSMERFYARDFLDSTTEIERPVSSSGRLGEVLTNFPYCDNYELLVAAEMAAVQSVRSVDRVVFCGAGPLPLTGILWHLSTGCEVSLVEVDARSAVLARAVVDRLAELQLVDRDAIHVEVGDAAEVALGGFGLVVVASLVPLPIVLSITANVVASGQRPIVAIRGALGLTARLAYDHIAAESVTGMAHIGTVAPEQVAWRLPAPADVAIEVSDPKLLVTASTGVLNTTELFV